MAVERASARTARAAVYRTQLEKLVWPRSNQQSLRPSLRATSFSSCAPWSSGQPRGLAHSRRSFISPARRLRLISRWRSPRLAPELRTAASYIESQSGICFRASSPVHRWRTAPCASFTSSSVCDTVEIGSRPLPPARTELREHQMPDPRSRRRRNLGPSICSFGESGCDRYGRNYGLPCPDSNVSV
jgi:hypothetical protein